MTEGDGDVRFELPPYAVAEAASALTRPKKHTGGSQGHWAGTAQVAHLRAGTLGVDSLLRNELSR